MQSMTTLTAAVAVALGAISHGAIAQDAYPSKPVTVIVPFQAGQGVDIMA